MPKHTSGGIEKTTTQRVVISERAPTWGPIRCSICWEMIEPGETAKHVVGSIIYGRTSRYSGTPVGVSRWYHEKRSTCHANMEKGAERVQDPRRPAP